MTGKELITLLKKNGWVVDRIKGSHHILVKEKETLVVPVHGKKQIPKGTLKSILKKAGLK
ncbi:MAG: type II toxin-antitoxin system HicA family toxin [Spirochaetota bacterium]